MRNEINGTVCLVFQTFTPTSFSQQLLDAVVLRSLQGGSVRKASSAKGSYTHMICTAHVVFPVKERGVFLTLSTGNGSGWSAVTLVQTPLAPFLTEPIIMAALSFLERLSLSVRLRVLSLRRLNASLSLLLVVL